MQVLMEVHTALRAHAVSWGRGGLYSGGGGERGKVPIRPINLSTDNKP